MGFIMLRLARVVLKGNNILFSVSVIFLVSTFESFLGFWEFFPQFVGRFFKRAREPKGKLRHVVYEV